jgi:hypothetical protein
MDVVRQLLARSNRLSSTGATPHHASGHAFAKGTATDPSPGRPPNSYD